MLLAARISGTLQDTAKTHGLSECLCKWGFHNGMHMAQKHVIYTHMLLPLQVVLPRERVEADRLSLPTG